MHKSSIQFKRFSAIFLVKIIGLREDDDFFFSFIYTHIMVDGPMYVCVMCVCVCGLWIDR